MIKNCFENCDQIIDYCVTTDIDYDLMLIEFSILFACTVASAKLKKYNKI